MTAAALRKLRDSSYNGLRLTARQYFALPDNGELTELVNGVVLVSPSPTPRHNHIAGEIYFQLRNFLERNPVGVALIETDAHVGKGQLGGDLVYRAEVIFIRKKRLPKSPTRPLSLVPDLMVEVVSDSSRQYDLTTKFHDYERCGVREYWVIDADRQSMKFFRRTRGKFREVRAAARTFQSEAVPGFALNLTALRAAFKPW